MRVDARATLTRFSEQSSLFKVLAIAAAALIVAVVIVGGVLFLSPHTFTVKGALLLNDSGVVADGGTCQSSSSGYSDIAGGGAVTITNADGKTLALGSMGKGKTVGTDGLCAFFFTIANVPDGGSFYGIEVTHRGIVQYTLKQMKAGPVLSLGDGS